jgi:hypothetical protein
VPPVVERADYLKMRRAVAGRPEEEVQEGGSGVEIPLA